MPSRPPAATELPDKIDIRREKNLSLDSFVVGKTLGTGAFGRVRLAHLRRGNADVDICALKVLKKQNLIENDGVKQTLHEKEIMMLLSAPRERFDEGTGKTVREYGHPFIVKWLACFHNQRYLYLALEFVQGGDFFTYLNQKGSCNSREARFYAAQLVSCFEFIHSKSIVFRDLKTENVLVAQDGYLKLADFGSAKILNTAGEADVRPGDISPIDSASYARRRNMRQTGAGAAEEKALEARKDRYMQGRTYSFQGTPEYIAPEILLNQGHTRAVDWWTLGIFIYDIMAGITPIISEEPDDPMEIYQKILCGKIGFSKKFSSRAKSLVKGLLTVDLRKRLGGGEVFGRTVDEIKNHEWFVGRREEHGYRPYTTSGAGGDGGDKVSRSLDTDADGVVQSVPSEEPAKHSHSKMADSPEQLAEIEKQFTWTKLMNKQLQPPWVPKAKTATDTSNFEEYPDSDTMPMRIDPANDPFADWGVYE